MQGSPSRAGPPPAEAEGEAGLAWQHVSHRHCVEDLICRRAVLLKQRRSQPLELYYAYICNNIVHVPHEASEEDLQRANRPRAAKAKAAKRPEAADEQPPTKKAKAAPATEQPPTKKAKAAPATNPAPNMGTSESEAATPNTSRKASQASLKRSVTPKAPKKEPAASTKPCKKQSAPTNPELDELRKALCVSI